MPAQLQDKLKLRVQACVVAGSVVLLAGKFVAYNLTRSVGVFTDAMESIVNVVAGAIGLYCIYVASRPSDHSHPFGHGKIEFISAFLEGLMIVTAGGIIIYEGIDRLYHPVTIDRLDIGIGVVAAAGLINYVMGAASIRTGRRHGSAALVASGKHLQSDTYSSVGLVIGLVLLYYTHIAWIDSLLAFIFGAVILFTGLRILRETVANLMDKADQRVLQTMTLAITENREEDWVDVHNLKTIRYGNHLYIDCDLTLPRYYTIVQGHSACDRLSRTLARYFSEHVVVSIHSDPCIPDQCCHCRMLVCIDRTHPFLSPAVLTLWDITKPDERHEKA